MKSGNMNMKTVDRIAVSAILAAALLILAMLGSTLRTSTQPLPTGAIALSAYVHPRHERAGGKVAPIHSQSSVADLVGRH